MFSSRLWRNGLFRLALVAAAIVAVVLIANATDGDAPKRSAVDDSDAQRERVKASKARARAAERNKPAVRRERARLKAEQKPHYGRGEPGLKSRAAQDALVGALERDITRDARRRHARGEVSSRASDTVCVHLVRPHKKVPPPPAVGTPEAGYECTAVTTRVPATSRNAAAMTGYPFWARVDFRTGRYAWCKVNLQPSEGGIGGTLANVPLEPDCDALEQGPA